MQNAYKSIEGYNPGINHKVLIAFNNMITNVFSNKKLYSIVT